LTKNFTKKLYHASLVEQSSIWEAGFKVLQILPEGSIKARNSYGVEKELAHNHWYHVDHYTAGEKVMFRRTPRDPFESGWTVLADRGNDGKYVLSNEDHSRHSV